MKVICFLVLSLFFSCGMSDPLIPFEEYYYDESIYIYGYTSDQLKNIKLAQYDSSGHIIDSAFIYTIITDTLFTDSLAFNKGRILEFEIKKSPIKMFPKYNWEITIDKDVYHITDIQTGVNPRCDMFRNCSPVWEVGAYKVNGKLIKDASNLSVTTDERIKINEEKLF